MKSESIFAPGTREPSSLVNFFAELLHSPPNWMRGAQIRAMAEAEAEAAGAGTTALELLKTAMEQQKSLINSSNRSKGGGRRPSEMRQRLCGMDPSDAGLILELCKRLGVLNRARLLALMSEEAINAEVVAGGQRPKSSDLAMRRTEREKKLKTFFEAPPKGIAKALSEKFAKLPSDDTGLKDELRAALARVYGGSTS